MRKFYRLADFTRYHESKNKSLIINAYQLAVGDFISFWDPISSMSINAEVLDRNSWDSELTVKPLEKLEHQYLKINTERHKIYVWSYAEMNAFKLCECGARHTSFPDKHMFYCKLWTPS